MTVKERLEAYRRRKRREEMMQSVKSVMKNIFSWNRQSGIERSIGESTSDEQVQLCEQSVDVQEEDVQEENVQAEDSTQESQRTVLNQVIYLLYFLLWATLYVIALEYEFGAVYFVLSALVFICLNTRSGPKQRGELSAYSVFNPNCEAIEGTLDASQFEKEIRYGIGGTR
ncbi:PREDICTED: SAYSvFN domain-containing protein 1 [Vollenhovia emeryi]|uniref:SAYSvFN domain-containing protein 1 n=1 Tax=Vollenhovia emeryi TaxID=411798 RepID=UPI0005F463B5|nr:PREDICTED: SAYSvFN domain-containing protein 1 [Vollenhovia emeryi]